MIDDQDDIPPGHTRKPRKIGPLPSWEPDWSWPRLSRLEIVVLACACLISMVVAIRAQRPEEEFWFVIVLGVGAYAEARRHRLPDIQRKDTITGFLEVAERGFTAMFGVTVTSLPGLWLGTRLRDYFGFAPPVTG